MLGSNRRLVLVEGANRVESVVAYLVRGDCFGEDALLSNSARNATVKMMQDGRLMRLGRRPFEEVLKPPVVAVRDGGATEIVRPHVIDKFVKKVLIGQDPFDRELLWQELAHWQRGSAGQLTDRTLAVVVGMTAERPLGDLPIDRAGEGQPHVLEFVDHLGRLTRQDLDGILQPGAGARGQVDGDLRAGAHAVVGAGPAERRDDVGVLGGSRLGCCVMCGREHGHEWHEGGQPHQSALGCPVQGASQLPAALTSESAVTAAGTTSTTSASAVLTAAVRPQAADRARLFAHAPVPVSA